ncbi:MAG: glycosyltransferase family 4 protein [Rhodospirillaceae bacterium]|nr:glycosyltransferase family 4 protein [Rhodospirillaceae bacterium]
MDKPATSTSAPHDAFGLTVLQVLPRLETGGVERGTVDVAAAIVAAGGRALVVSAGGRMEAELARTGAEHVAMRVDRKSPGRIRRNAGRLADLIRREQVDIVHARSRAPAWSARAAARRTGVPCGTTFHGVSGTGCPIKRVWNRIMTAGDRTIAVSDYIADHIRQRYRVPDGRIAVIHRGVDLDLFDVRAVSEARVVQLAERWQLPDGAPAIMLPGRFARWKGHAVLIDALALMQRADAVALLIGADAGREGYRDELLKQVRRRGLDGAVRFIDHCNDMPAAYMLADVVVSASTRPEAFGRIAAEAQAMGRPAIATDHGGARETVIPGETGWLTPPGDARALAGALDAALSLTEAERARMAKAAVANVRRNFSKNSMTSRTLALYAELAGERSRDSGR